MGVSDAVNRLAGVDATGAADPGSCRQAKLPTRSMASISWFDMTARNEEARPATLASSEPCAAAWHTLSYAPSEPSVPGTVSSVTKIMPHGDVDGLGSDWPAEEAGTLQPHACTCKPASYTGLAFRHTRWYRSLHDCNCEDASHSPFVVPSVDPGYMELDESLQSLHVSAAMSPVVELPVRRRAETSGQPRSSNERFVGKGPTLEKASLLLENTTSPAAFSTSPKLEKRSAADCPAPEMTATKPAGSAAISKAVDCFAASTQRLSAAATLDTSVPG
mmetsp:Transcript_15473/g.48376  ORF Transcript_15473/g.48376 Transcript_15473/m.48376 type:complete len:276 (+) Transcript_15473:4967-5794(+)